MEKKQEFNKLSLKAPFLNVDFNPVKEAFSGRCNSV